MRKLQITAIGEPAEVLELVEFQAPAPCRPVGSQQLETHPAHVPS